MRPAVWVTSDTHFGHANIVRHCGRPFHSVEEMDEFLILCWNEVVSPEDVVLHLGDFSLRGDPARYLERLNGHVHLIRGNHDGSRSKMLRAGFASVDEVDAVGGVWVSTLPGVQVWSRLSHRPPKADEGPGPDEVWLHGHSHGRAPRRPRVQDVGVDCTGFRPVRLEGAVVWALGW